MVFNYSKFANLGFWMDCITFWDIFGTFKMLTKSGPSDPSVLQKYFKKYKKHMESFLKQITFINMGIYNFEQIRNIRTIIFNNKSKNKHTTYKQ